MPRRSRSFGEISPIRRCSGASLPSKPRQVTISNAGSPYMSDSEARALRLVPSPEFCITTTGRRPPSQAPAAGPTAASSRTAGTYGSRRRRSRAVMRSSTSEHGTPVKKSKPCRSRRAASSAPDTTPGSPQPRGPLVLLLLDDLSHLRPHLPHELVVGRGRDDLVELRPVVGDEADALDDHVVHEPLLALVEHPVVDGDLGPLLRHQPCADDRRLAVERLAHELDLLAAVELDSREVRALEEIREELHELLALGGRPAGPVPGQRALGRLREVEDVVGDLPDRGPPLLLLSFLLQLGVLEELDDAGDLRAELVGRDAGPRPAGAGEDQPDESDERERAGDASHRRPPTPCRKCTSTGALRNPPGPRLRGSCRSDR